MFATTALGGIMVVSDDGLLGCACWFLFLVRFLFLLLDLAFVVGCLLVGVALRFREGTRDMTGEKSDRWWRL